MRMMFALGFATIALQRLGLPIGENVLPFPPLLALAAISWMLFIGEVKLVKARVAGFAVFLGLGAVGVISSGDGLNSVLQIAIIWAPLMFSFEKGAPRRYLTGVVAATLVASLIGVMQSMLTMVGAPLIDPVPELPQQIVVPGFNSSYEVIYASGWMKANGVFFLEPSLLSLFGGLAALLILADAVDLPKWLPRGAGVLIAFVGVISTVAVSFLVLAPAYIVWIARNFRTALPWLAGVAVVVPLLMLLPQTAPLTARIQDTETSSNDARLVRPYTEVVPVVAEGAPWIGFGPGSGHQFIKDSYVGWQTELTTPTAVKTFYEYGLIGVILLGLLVVSLWRGSSMPTAARLGILIALIIPTDGLASGLLAPVALLALATEHDARGPTEDKVPAAARDTAPDSAPDTAPNTAPAPA